jgi:hypothetical protein
MCKLFLKSYLSGMGKKKKPNDMTELTKNFDQFMAGKEYHPKAEEKFEKVLKKTVTGKQNPKVRGK